MSLSKKLDAAAVQRELNRAGQESWTGMALSADSELGIPQLVGGAAAAKAGASGLIGALVAVANQVAVAPVATAPVAAALVRNQPKSSF